MSMLSPFDADQRGFGVPCSEVRLTFPREGRNVLCRKSASMVCYNMSSGVSPVKVFATRMYSRPSLLRPCVYRSWRLVAQRLQVCFLYLAYFGFRSCDLDLPICVHHRFVEPPLNTDLNALS